MSDAKIRDIERRLKVIDDRVTQHTDRARKYLQHHYQSMPAIGTVATEAIVQNDLDIILCPVHLDRPMEARRVSFIAGSNLDAETNDCRIATAFYRAVRPSHGTKADLVTEPGQGVSFALHAPMGVTLYMGGDQRMHHHTIEKDAELNDGVAFFLAFHFGNYKNTHLYAPQHTAAGVSAFLAARTEAGYPFGSWPAVLDIDRTRTAKIPFFVVRSSLGVRLYGDPVLG